MLNWMGITKLRYAAPVVALLFTAAACGGDPSLDEGSLAQAAKGGGAASKDAKLNLSHIECTEEGVRAHFVLLFAGSATPGALTGTSNQGPFGPAYAYKNSGNVWHYEVYFASGHLDITAAAVGTTTLHNPSAYAGDYQCNGNPVCEVVVEPQAVYCTDQPLGNPGAECGAFGLTPLGKDDNLTGLTHTATMDAYVALVKSGNRGCGPGNSAYRVYVNVTAGDELSTPVDQNISHVTYCECPAY